MKNLTLSYHATFKDAIRTLDENGNGFLAIIDDSLKLVGILTDGDIRRAVLNNKNNLMDIINKEPLTMKKGIPKKLIFLKLKEIHRKHMPIVDDNGVLVDVVILDEIEFNSKSNIVVIMAGGLGSRLGELTKKTPKPMLHVGRKPMLHNLIDNFMEHGFTKFYISVNYKAEVIKSYFQDGSEFGIEIKYIEEDKRLGTAGALSLIKDKIENPFFVINGDILTTLNFEEVLKFHNDNHSMATMCVRKYEYQIPYGVVKSDDSNISAIEEKPSFDFLINAGIYVLNPDLIASIPEDCFYDMPDLFKNLISMSKTTLSYEVVDYWVDIGQINDYEKVLNDFKY